MEGLFESFGPFLRKYTVESILLGIALILGITSITIYVYNSAGAKQEPSKDKIAIQTAVGNTVYMVEVSGAIKKAGVYSFKSGQRLRDAIEKAEGLSDEADASFFARNFNLARFLTDQEKIYIPSQQEIINDIFSSRKILLDYTQPQTITRISQETITPSVVSINTSTTEEIDALPGIGAATSSKIIQSRPYATLEELITKKAVSKNIFEQIKNLITL